MLVCIFFTIANLTVIAEEEYAQISIKETPTYELISQNISGNRIISRFKIYITFENKGNVSSHQIKVNLTDQDGIVLTKQFTIESLETKIITFDWSTIFNENQELKINYGPADLSVTRTKYNSGKTSLTIKVVENDGGGSTPGFEIMTLTIAILFSIFLKKNRNKKC
jgi:hypothetical protein